MSLGLFVGLMLLTAYYTFSSLNNAKDSNGEPLASEHFAKLITFKKFKYIFMGLMYHFAHLYLLEGNPIQNFEQAMQEGMVSVAFIMSGMYLAGLLMKRSRAIKKGR